MKLNTLNKIIRSLRKALYASIIIASPLMVSCDSSSNSSSQSGSSNAIQNLDKIVIGDPDNDFTGLKYDSSTSSFYFAIGLSERSSNNECSGFFGDALGNPLPIIESIPRSAITITESLDSDGFPVYDVEFPPIIRTGDGLNTEAGTHTILVKFRFGFIIDDSNNTKINEPTISGTHDIAIYDLEITCDGVRIDKFDPAQEQGEGEYTF